MSAASNSIRRRICRSSASPLILEDVIEFLIVEGLADARDGWNDVLRATARPTGIQLRGHPSGSSDGL
jgi:hypothetical protein